MKLQRLGNSSLKLQTQVSLEVRDVGEFFLEITNSGEFFLEITDAG